EIVRSYPSSPSPEPSWSTRAMPGPGGTSAPAGMATATPVARRMRSARLAAIRLMTGSPVPRICVVAVMANPSPAVRSMVPGSGTSAKVGGSVGLGAVAGAGGGADGAGCGCAGGETAGGAGCALGFGALAQAGITITVTSTGHRYRFRTSLLPAPPTADAFRPCPDG